MAASKTQADQPLPQNLDAERAVLGYLLMGGKWQDAITARDFVLEIHQILWRAMRTIHTAGEEIDLRRLSVQLSEREMNHIGRGYLADLGEGCYTGMNIRPFVAKLHEATVLRDILHHTHIMMTHIHTGTRSASELIAMGADAFTGMAVEGHASFSYRDVPSIWTWEAEVSWMVETLLPEAAITLLTGDSGHGKTIFATALAGAVATGGEFLGRPARQRKVLYCDRENPAAVVKQHLHDLGIPETKDLVVWGNWCEREADGPASRSLLEFATSEKPLLLFDPAIAFHPGDEQSSTETRAFMSHCRKLAGAGATVLLLHHIGKGENAKMYRGSSDYKASVDVAYLLEKLGDPAGPLKELRLMPFKNRFAGGLPLALSFHGRGFTVADRPETVSEILERLIRTHPGETLRELVALARAEGLGKNQAEQEISRGVQQGRWEVRKAGKHHGYYLRDIWLN
jgi:hypothetical protein